MKTLPKMRRLPKGMTSQPLGVRLIREEIAEIEKFADDEQRSRAWFIRSLILRGLDDYKRELASHP